MYNLIVV